MVIASIDLMGGKAVQLKQGKEKVLQREDPLQLAQQFDQYGEVGVIDLDAAFGQGDNRRLLEAILRKAECRVGGGIRSVEQAQELISLGARRIIIGSKAFEKDCVNHAFLQELTTALPPENIIIAIDSLAGEIVSQGWKHRTGLDLVPTAHEISPYAAEFLFTCVEREGRMEGIDFERVKQLKSAVRNKVTVAGGVASLAELKTLAELGVDVQLGMALYTGKIALQDAFVESLTWRQDLLPTITQDPSGQVLMLAYSNHESLKKSFATQKMTYYSRSRQSLWVKGETSGNFQQLLRLRADCDRDALLATVRQTDVACHQGAYSCFGEKHFSLHELYDVIRRRLKKPRPGSYTATLTDELLRNKILEEAQEVVEACTREDIVWEAADVLYFLNVYLAKNDVALEDVLFELRRRRR